MHHGEDYVKLGFYNEYTEEQKYIAIKLVKVLKEVGKLKKTGV